MKSIRDRICEQIIPTDIRVFYEDGMPYISYKGIAVRGFDEWEIEIPKMSMVLNTLERFTEIEETIDIYGNTIHRRPVCNQFFASHDVAYRMCRKKRKMTKADIERELGCKVDIIGE